MKKKFIIPILVILLFTACSTADEEKTLQDIHIKEMKDILIEADYEQVFLDDMEVLYLGQIDSFHFYRRELSDPLTSSDKQLYRDYELLDYNFKSYDMASVFCFEEGINGNVYYPLIGAINTPLMDKIDVVYELIYNEFKAE